MSDILTPAFVYVVGALITLLIRNHILRGLFLLAVPVAALATFVTLPYANYNSLPLFDLHLGFLRIDALSFVFALVFSLAAFLSPLYAWHVRDKVEQVASLLYAGAAIGAVFAADLVTLFVFWEGTALASVFLIWARRTEGSYYTGGALSRDPGRLRPAAARGHRASLSGHGLHRLRAHGTWQPRHVADLPRLRHQMRLPATQQLVARRLSRRDANRHGDAVGLHDQARRLRSGARLRGHGISSSISAR